MKRTSLIVALAVLAILVAAIVLPALFVEPKPATNLPWQVSVSPAGGLQVFGMTVGETTLDQAEARFGTTGEVTLFRAPSGAIAVEAYFDNINMNGLGAKIVLGIRIPDAELEPMYGRGVRVSKLGSGAQTVTLASSDRQRVGAAPVDTLTYMPAIKLEPALIAKRFGEPAEKWKEQNTGVVHWLYPAIGLDVAMNEGEKEVLQYVPPADFARLREPLTAGERLP